MDDAILRRRLWEGFADLQGLLGGHARQGRVLRRPGLLASVVPSAPDSPALNAAVAVEPEAAPDALDELAREYARVGVRRWAIWIDGGAREATTRLLVRGAAGLVTDGALRDTPEIKRIALPAYARGPSPLTNLAQHHAVDLQVPIGCAEVPVYPGDVMVGDAEGVVCVPRHLAAEVAEAAVAQEELERFIQREIEAGRPLRGTYPPDAETRARYEQARRRE